MRKTIQNTQLDHTGCFRYRTILHTINHSKGTEEQRVCERTCKGAQWTALLIACGCGMEGPLGEPNKWDLCHHPHEGVHLQCVEWDGHQHLVHYSAD